MGADEGSAVLNFRNRCLTAGKKCSLNSDLSASDRKFIASAFTRLVDDSTADELELFFP